MSWLNDWDGLEGGVPPTRSSLTAGSRAEPLTGVFGGIRIRSGFRLARSSIGLGRGPLKAERRVRFPYALPLDNQGQVRVHHAPEGS